MNKINLRFGILVALIVLAAFSRVIPHMLNFSPLGAIGIFGAAYFSRKWQAILIPIAATWLSDLFIDNVIYAKYYPHFTWFYTDFYWTYGSYLLIALTGLLIFRKSVTPGKVLVGALSSSAIFFLITNFSCWPGSTYTQNFSGLLDCYAAGIPYLKGTLLGDLSYAAILFGSFAWLQQRFPALRPAKISSAQ